MDCPVRSQSGATLVESLIAFSLIAGSAMALFPLFVKAKASTKAGDVRQLCMNVVRGKLDEYKHGRVTPFPSADPRLSKLTVPTVSGTSVTGLGTAGASVQVTGAFFYSKLRYNQNFPYACTGTPRAAILAGTSHENRPFGMRECVGSDQTWDDSVVPAPVTCNSQADRDVRRELPNFKLYVRLENSTSWPLAGKVFPDRLANDCPGNASLGAGGSLYDFDGAGDAIKVTVTGVIDLTGDGHSIQELGGIPSSDPSRLMCSASVTVRPATFPVRYFKNVTGQIFTVHGHGQNGSNAGFVFQRLNQHLGGSASGITSFAVHPRNIAVYVLKPGVLLRYSNCGGYPVDCDPSFNAAGGLSDDGATGWPSVQSFELEPSIRHIGVDFRSGTVYGMFGDNRGLIRIAAAPGGGAVTPLRAVSAPSVALSDMSFATVVDGDFPAPVGWTSDLSQARRLRSFFVSPEGDAAFVSDYAESSSIRGIVYTSSIYRMTDTQLAFPVLKIPVQAVSFSK